MSVRFVDYIKLVLRQHRYEHVFGVPGSYIMPLWQEMDGTPSVVTARHESGAVFMADGWGRARGLPGVALVTAGPGLSNALTGIASAFRDSVPLLVISGQVDTDLQGSGAFQECYPVDRGFSLTDMFGAVTKASIEIRSAHQARALFDLAFDTALSGRPGPVHLSIPYAIQMASVGDATVTARPAPRAVAATGPDIRATEGAARIVARMGRARRPLLLLGWGIELAGLGLLARAAVERSRLPTVCSVKGMALPVRDLDTFMGHLGPGDRHATREWLRRYKPDLLVSVGASLSSYYFNGVKAVIDGNIAVVDRDPTVAAARAGATERSEDLAGLLALLGRGERLKSDEAGPHSAGEPSSAMSPYMEELRESCDGDALVIPDAGNHWLETLHSFSRGSAASVHTNCGFGSMGWALGSSIGMQLGSPEKTVVCVTGDGCLLMSGNELSVAAEHRLPIIYIAFNNRSMGRVIAAQTQVYGGKYVGARLPVMALARWGAALGMEAHRVEDVPEFRRVLRRALAERRPTLIEVALPGGDIPRSLMS